MRDAVRTDPRDRSLIDSLERLAELSNRWTDLDGLVDDIARRGDLERRELYELRLRSAGWYRDRMADPSRAEHALTEALQLDPEPLEAHAERVALIREQGRTADLVNGLRAWADVEPSIDVDALRALCDIRRAQSRWNEVVGLLERQSELVEGEDRAPAAQAVGQVYRDHLNDPRAAIRAYEGALDLDETDLGRRGRSLSAAAPARATL
ncbi:MAG: hypothetical protein JRF54_14115 [Deltaproteobacteria bacterium]|nr:hypothetical protein [Deltaproteobacteria bacterium]